MHVHEYHYTVERLADGSLAFRDPRGCIVPAVPTPLGIGASEAIERIRRDNARLAIDGHTAMHGWDGRPINYTYCVEDLAGADDLEPPPPPPPVPRTRRPRDPDDDGLGEWVQIYTPREEEEPNPIEYWLGGWRQQDVGSA